MPDWRGRPAPRRRPTPSGIPSDRGTRNLADVSGLILAGGQGRRLGGVDKGLVEVAGLPMISHVLARFAPQVGPLFISANRNLARYAAFGHPVLADTTADYGGPLEGMASALARCETPYLAVVPCDSPFLPLDLVARLRQAAQDAAAEVAVAAAAGRLQPVFALLAAGLLPSLRAYLASGEHKLDRWYAQHRMQTVEFPDGEQAFENVNTDVDRAKAEARLHA